jgi:hypothetical protein
VFQIIALLVILGFICATALCAPLAVFSLLYGLFSGLEKL